MKTRFITLAIATLALLFGATSCDKGNTQDELIYYGFATTHTNGKTDNSAITFITDDLQTLRPDKAVTSSFKARDNQRVVIYFSIPEMPKEGDQEMGIKLYQIDTNVIVGKTAYVESQDAISEYGTDGVSFNTSPNTPQTTASYINVYVGTNASKIRQHDFTLIYDKSNPGDDSSTKFTLAHHARGDVSSLEAWTWVSFPLEPFSQDIAGKKSAVVSVKTRMNGVQTITLPLPGANDKTKAKSYFVNE